MQCQPGRAQTRPIRKKGVQGLFLRPFLTGRFHLAIVLVLQRHAPQRGLERSGNTTARVVAAVSVIVGFAGSFFGKQLVEAKNMNENSSLDENDLSKIG